MDNSTKFDLVVHNPGYIIHSTECFMFGLTTGNYCCCSRRKRKVALVSCKLKKCCSNNKKRISDFRCQKYLSENVLKINCAKKFKKILNTTFSVESFITLKTYNSKKFPGNILEFSIKYLPAAAPGTNKIKESIFIIRLSTIRLTTRNWSFFF